MINAKAINDKNQNNINFPENFIFWTATSAFQIEGEGETEWKGLTGKDGRSLGNGIDHYERIDEDLRYILYLGDAYRFSMDWSKLQKGPIKAPLNFIWIMQKNIGGIL